MKTKVFLILLLSLLILPLIIQTKGNSIAWDPAKIEQTMGLGDTKEITVTFISNTYLENADLWIAKELQPFVSVEPNHFESIEANSTYEVGLYFSIPYDAETRLYDGTIHIKVGSKTYPQTLKIELNIEDVAKIIGPEGGIISTTNGLVTVEIPAGAIAENTLLTISPTEENGFVGNIYEFNPSGLFFAFPVKVSFFYLEDLITENIKEEDFFLASIGEYLEILNNIQIDPINNKISGKTLHFSKIGIGAYFPTVNIIDFDEIVSEIRMPIGDARRFTENPICGPIPSPEDVGENPDLLNIASSPITFNSSGASNNRWYVSVDFLESYDYGIHPGEDWNDLRYGDFDKGSPIHAIADGIVLYSNNEKTGFGNIIVIGHKLSNGKIIASVYAHMLYLSPCVQFGGGNIVKEINKGDIIGLIGKSGGDWPAHLHFEITKENCSYLKIDGEGNIKLPSLLDKRWNWPGRLPNAEEFINNNYYNPSSFIRNFSPTIPIHQYEFITKWGSSGNEDGQFQNPWGIAVDSSGYVYVADASNCRIQKFTSSGSFVTKWGNYGSGDGQFNQPQGIAVNSAGDIFVTDHNQRIQKFTSTGSFVTKWGSPGYGDGQFAGPIGIAVDSSGYVYVVEGFTNRIQKFTSTGSFVTKWGSPGSGDGKFDFPTAIAVDSSGYVYVSDYGNNRIQKFTSSGTFVTKWGSSGSGDSQFGFLWGIAVDSSGYVYVPDGGNNRIQKFTSAGSFMTKWGSSGNEDGQFNAPTGIAVDSSGYVYVADSGNSRIQKFRKVE